MITTEQLIVATVAECMAVDTTKITRDTRFIDDLGADSLDIVDLTMRVEERCNVGEIDEDAIMKFETVGQLVDYVNACRQRMVA